MADPNLISRFSQRALPQIHDLEAFSGSLHPDVDTFDLQDINKYVFSGPWFQKLVVSLCTFWQEALLTLVPLNADQKAGDDCGFDWILTLVAC
jgi:hypothetical protein